ncbi:MAG: O-antigen ligase family protein, partial [Anaerolineae bacterium]|nr:O-antigen ligase family protein [Anaerolineae bacterium]
QSRAAWVGMLVAALILLAGRASWGLWALLGVVVAGLIGWAIWGHDLIAPHIVQALVGPLPTSWGTVTLEGRLSIWETAAGYVLRQPWLGQGLGTFRLEGVQDLAGRSVFDVGLPHAHNVLLGVAYDLGLPGLVAYLSLLLTWVMLGWHSLERMLGPERQVVLGALAGLVGAHAYGMMDAVALGAKPGVLFWMLGALIGVEALAGSGVPQHS